MLRIIEIRILCLETKAGLNIDPLFPYVVYLFTRSQFVNHFFSIVIARI